MLQAQHFCGAFHTIAICNQEPVCIIYENIDLSLDNVRSSCTLKMYTHTKSCPGDVRPTKHAYTGGLDKELFLLFGLRVAT